MTNAYMKDSLKRITAVILLAAATLLVALQCGSIAKKRGSGSTFTCRRFLFVQ